MGRPSSYTDAEIYTLADPNTGEVRYVGKAVDAAKRLKSHLRDSRTRNTPVYCWIRKLAKEQQYPVLSVVAVVPYAEWPGTERRVIAEMRAAGIRLLNVASGGDEPYCPPEVRAANGAKVAKIRTVSKHIWNAQRVLAANAKWAKDNKRSNAAKLEAGVTRFRAAVERHTLANTLDVLDERLGAFFASIGRASAQNSGNCNEPRG